MLFKNTRGEGMISNLVAMVLIVGTLAAIIFWFVLNVGQFQLEHALNSTLKAAQVQGYLSPTLKSASETQLLKAGFTSATVSSPQSGPVPYGGEIEIDITVSTLSLPDLDVFGHAANSPSTLSARGFIISQFAP